MLFKKIEKKKPCEQRFVKPVMKFSILTKGIQNIVPNANKKCGKRGVWKGFFQRLE